jgi:hypothetical protein
LDSEIDIDEEITTDDSSSITDSKEEEIKVDEIEVDTTKAEYVLVRSESSTTEESEETYNTEESFYVPYGDTSFFAYMDCHLFGSNTKQQEIQNSCWTDSYGLRRYGDDYVIALGSYYGTEIGTRYLITLEDGTSFTAVLGDAKSDCDTDSYNQYTYAGYGNYKNVVEFIVDQYSLSYDIKNAGTVSAIPEFNGGSITSISKIS